MCTFSQINPILSLADEVIICIYIEGILVRRYVLPSFTAHGLLAYGHAVHSKSGTQEQPPAQNHLCVVYGIS